MNQDDSTNSLETLETSEKPLVALESSKPKVTTRLKHGLNIKNRLSIYSMVFIAVMIIVILLVLWLYTVDNQKTADDNKVIPTQALNTQDLASLKSSDVKIGDSKQTLTVDANASFSGAVLIKGGLDIAGPLKVGSSLNLPGIVVAGNSTFDAVSLNTLKVSQSAIFSGSTSVQSNLSVAKDLSVGGDLKANKFITDFLAVSGNISFTKHIDSGGPRPSISSGAAIGGGGTSSISGTDSAGNININTGSGTSAGTMVSVQFASPFSETPNIAITPVGAGAASINYYITKTATGFILYTINSPSTGSNFGFDYIVLE
jgi:cytoskeletal protein CcmA (bactofilin family)